MGHHAPAGQQTVMIVLTYIGWSILPLVSPAMAVADMDMTRRRNGETTSSQRPLAALPPAQRPQAVPGQQPSKWGNPNPSPQVAPKQAAPQQVQRPAQPQQQGGTPNNGPLPGIARPAPVSS